MWLSPDRELLLCCRAFSDINYEHFTNLINLCQFLLFSYLISAATPVERLKMSTFTSVVSDKVSGEAQSSMLFQKCSFCHFKWKNATEEMKWDITVCWQQWLWLFHCSICLVFDNEIEVVLRDSPVYCLEPIWQVESGAIVRGVLVELQ